MRHFARDMARQQPPRAACTHFATAVILLLRRGGAAPRAAGTGAFAGSLRSADACQLVPCCDSVTYRDIRLLPNGVPRNSSAAGALSPYLHYLRARRDGARIIFALPPCPSIPIAACSGSVAYRTFPSILLLYVLCGVAAGVCRAVYAGVAGGA